MYEYFQYFFKDGWLPWRVVLIAYFSLFLIIPLYGHPNSTNPETNSALVSLTQNVVLVLSLVAVAETNRRVDPKLRRSGRWVLLLVAVPMILISLSSFSTLAFGSVPRWILRAMSSLALIVPLLIVIAVLVESIIRTRYGARIPRLPLLLAFVSIFLIMYTFATFYFINGLLEGPGGIPADFADALYTSGLALTTMGFTTIEPIGVGRLLAVFESVSGSFILSLLTAIFIQMVKRPRE